MKPPSRLPSAEDLDVLLGAAYPEASARRAQYAARHQRRVRSVGPQRLLRDVLAEANPGAERNAGPRSYVHRRPTRSAVLNAFLHELGETFPARASVADEQAFAFELFGIARPYLLRMLIRDNVRVALRLASELRLASNEGMARFAIPQAARGSAGALADIARDYEQRRGIAPPGDLLLSCMVAAFAARIVVYAEQLDAPHAREDALIAVRLRLNRKGVAHGRAASSSTGDPPAAAPAAPAAAPVRRELTRRGESARGPAQGVAGRAEAAGNRRSRQ